MMRAPHPDDIDDDLDALLRRTSALRALTDVLICQEWDRL